MVGILPAVTLRDVQGTDSGLCKTVEIPTGHVSPQSIMTESIPTYT